MALPLRRAVTVAPLSGVRILVVEDAPGVLEILTTLLRLEGADVAGAATGREALELFGVRRFDLLISDLGLPDIPGEVVIGAIVSVARAPLSVVVITGEMGPRVAAATDAGANAIFAKPCDWDAIMRYLSALPLRPVA